MGLKGKGLAFRWIVDHVAHSGDECLTWPFAKDSKGYGMLGLNGKTWKAYRLMCLLAHGEAPTKKHYASHSCGNGHLGCTNPRHLEWKTPSENQLDRARHGRKNNGLGRYGRKTTPEQVIEIQALRGKMTIVKIAEKFGIKRGSVDYWHRKARETELLPVD